MANKDKIGFTADAKPGSEAAILRGCKCSQIDNRHGEGRPSSVGTAWVIACNCPLHFIPAESGKYAEGGRRRTMDQKAFDEGERAAILGQSEFYNPYCFDDDQAAKEAWNKGWQSAQDAEFE